ncbi:RNA polymerase sigma factor [Sorangium sp. So ce406]|uniref:RNA polymerase sigma factor n=1 Tax=Sorangium sp. So ce406 TaxID=3133311 RepID=UPI003F5AE266
MHRPRTGFSVSFRRLLEANAARVRSLVSHVGVPSRDLDDVMQEATVRLWEKREQARSARNPSAFRDSVVLNTARDHRRAARRREEALTGLDEAALWDERQSPEDHAIARQEAALVRQLIDQIGERCRGVFIACELLERPIADVAREQEIPLETARSRLRRAWEEFEAAAARWEARQRGRGARRLRAVLFPPWLLELLERRSFRRGGPARWVARGFAIACAAALGALAALGTLATGPMESVTPLRTAMTPLASRRTTGPATVQARRDPTEMGLVGHAPDESVTISPRLHGAATTPTTPDWAVTSPAAAAAPPRRPAAHPQAISSRERGLVARARTAVVAGDVVSLVEARRLLEEHGRRFPRGRLAREREALLGQLR